MAQRRLELGLDHLLTLEASQVRLVPGEDSDMETELDLDNVTLWTLKKKHLMSLFTSGHS